MEKAIFILDTDTATRHMGDLVEKYSGQEYANIKEFVEIINKEDGVQHLKNLDILSVEQFQDEWTRKHLDYDNSVIGHINLRDEFKEQGITEEFEHQVTIVNEEVMNKIFRDNHCVLQVSDGKIYVFDMPTEIHIATYYPQTKQLYANVYMNGIIDLCVAGVRELALGDFVTADAHNPCSLVNGVVANIYPNGTVLVVQQYVSDIPKANVVQGEMVKGATVFVTDDIKDYTGGSYAGVVVGVWDDTIDVAHQVTREFNKSQLTYTF